MKVYRGSLKKETAAKLNNNKGMAARLCAPTGLGKPSSNTTTVAETVAKYNPGITKDEIAVWVWYRQKKGIPMTTWKSFEVDMTENKKLQLVRDGYMFIDPSTKDFVPLPVFVFGNIYEKLGKLKKLEDELTKSYGHSVYESHVKMLEKHKPKPISIQNPVEAERPIILAISEDARKKIYVSSLRNDSGVILDGEVTLQEAFRQWLKAQPKTSFKAVDAYNITRYYLYNENKPRGFDKIEWKRIKKNTRDEGEKLFKEFLHTALEVTDQLKIDATYNSKYNATAPLLYQKIPIGIEVSRKFKGFDLALNPAQREGIAFMELTGSGIIAYDVGVGKTITAIVEMAAAIKNGKCKRPLVVVPNPTYKNWLLEMLGEDGSQGVLTDTGITVNDWNNLGVDYDHIKLDRKVDEGSITLVTYEGLNKIGFNEFTQNEHFEHLSNVLGQIDDSQTERNKEKENEGLRELIGVGLKETVADIETLGFDYVSVDEAHNFKNIFTTVKGDDERGKQFQISGGKPSNRAIKLFFLSNYIQRKYGRNVMLLTATPFTNSPLEIYSMLSLVAHDYMVKNNILHIRHFFEQYIQETAEYVVGVDGEIKQKDVVKSFNNRISLQKLINSHINFKTGEEANIPRPCKINLPKTTKETDSGVVKLKPNNQILTYLKQNEAQEANQRIINKSASEGASKDDPGKLLRLMSQNLNNALSPFLYSGKPVDYLDFIQNSPKINYVMQCVRMVKEWHEKRNQPVSGQVIYMDRGKHFFTLIKQYLEIELGYKKGQKLISNPRQKVDEVEFVTGGISSSKKEKIKEAFNEGVCKIIIGTSTIKEGINLQKKSTVLYNTYPNWNPTDIRQLEGRIWRQKNEFGYVRIVMPLIENSMDVFVFQKLDEKTSRINDLWSKSDRGNVLDEESLDPNEVKFALVTDINKLLRFELKVLNTDLVNKVRTTQSQIDDLDNYENLLSRYSTMKEKILVKIDVSKRTLGNMPIGDNLYYRSVPELNAKELTKEVKDKIERFNNCDQMLGEILQGDHEDKSIIKAYGYFKRLNDSIYGTSYNWDFDQYKNTVSELGKIKKSLFTNRGFDDSTDISKIKQELDKELLSATDDVEDLKSEAFQKKLYNNIKKEKERLSIKGGSLKDRVSDFSSLNHLLSYKFSDVDPRSCYIPEVELKKTTVDQQADKPKRLRLAKAKAKALKLKLLLAA